MSDYGERYRQAEALRKNEQFEKAESAFHALWAELPNPNVGWRWIYCLRKLGYGQTAMQVALLVTEAFPEDMWVQREYAWCIYSHEVKIAQAQKDVGRTMYFAQKMLDMVSDDLIRKQAVFAVVDTAKERGKWDIVSQWCDRLDPEQLSSEMNAFGEQKSMSDRERWYYAKVKALVHIKQWSEARQLALKARESFHYKDDFPRWAAQARASEGDVVGAAEEIENLIRRGNTQWYILADLAQMKRQEGKNEEALQTACKAALAFGEDKAKVNLFALLAELGLVLEHVEFAAYHIALTKFIRTREGWSVKEDLMRLEKLVNTSSADVSLILQSANPRRLFSVCQTEWRKYVTAGRARYTGKICNLPTGKNFAFIAPDTGGENIHVFLREISRTAQTLGARVGYSLEPSFDHKKNRESFRAVDVRLTASGKVSESDR